MADANLSCQQFSKLVCLGLRSSARGPPVNMTAHAIHAHGQLENSMIRWWLEVIRVTGLGKGVGGAGISDPCMPTRPRASWSPLWPAATT